jgi:septal ring factor EnvC (AmiA/AmiB activator)
MHGLHTYAAVRRASLVSSTLYRLGLCALLVASLAGGSVVHAQDKTRSRLAELESIRGQIARLQARLERVRSKRAGLAGEIERLDLRLQLQKQRIAEAATARSLLEERWHSTQQRVKDLEVAEREAREDLRVSLISLYRLGRGGYLRLGLSISSGTNMLQGIRQLRYFARRDAAAFRRYLDTKARLSVERDELATQRERLDGWLATEKRRRAEMKTLRARQRRLLEQTDREQTVLADRTRALREKARKLAELLDALYGRNTTALGGRPIEDFRGALDWPAGGSVVLEFGPQKDPRYNTLIPHNGIDISTSPGSAVRAVYPGKVVFAANFQGYGPTVVVMHPERVFTLYAGLSQLEVKRGAVISLDQQLGRASDRLYFEIRVRNRPENPRQWLR